METCDEVFPGAKPLLMAVFVVVNGGEIRDADDGAERGADDDDDDAELMGADDAVELWAVDDGGELWIAADGTELWGTDDCAELRGKDDDDAELTGAGELFIPFQGTSGDCSRLPAVS